MDFVEELLFSSCNSNNSSGTGISRISLWKFWSCKGDDVRWLKGIIKLASWYSSMLKTRWVSGFGGFPYHLPSGLVSGFNTWNLMSANMSGNHILLSVISLSINPIQSNRSARPSERVKFPTPPVASSQLVLATSLAPPSGPSKGMSLWASIKHGWQQYTKNKLKEIQEV